jgi:hypothetical protein
MRFARNANSSLTDCDTTGFVVLFPIPLFALLGFDSYGGHNRIDDEAEPVWTRRDFHPTKRVRKHNPLFREALNP